MYFLPNCRYEIILIRDLEETQQELDEFCFTYLYVDCRYTLFKYRLSGDFDVKSRQVFGNVQGAIYFNQGTTRVYRMNRIAKKKLLRRNNQSNN